MVIEILNAGEIFVNCKFKLNKNLNLNLYCEIPQNSSPIKISIRLCTVRYRDIWFSRSKSHLPRNGLYIYCVLNSNSYILRNFRTNECFTICDWSKPLTRNKISEISRWQKFFSELKISNPRISCTLNGVRRSSWKVVWVAKWSYVSDTSVRWQIFCSCSWRAMNTC